MTGNFNPSLDFETSGLSAVSSSAHLALTINDWPFGKCSNSHVIVRLHRSHIPPPDTIATELPLTLGGIETTIENSDKSSGFVNFDLTWMAI
jgi:hypothetical protein